MKLKEIIPQTRVGHQAPALTVDLKYGVLRLNLAALKLLGISADAKLAFHQEEDKPENWYIEVNKSGAAALRVTPTKPGGKAIRAQVGCRGIANQLAECADVPAGTRTFTLPIAGQPTMFEKRKLYGLLVVAGKRTAKGPKKPKVNP